MIILYTVNDRGQRGQTSLTLNNCQDGFKILYYRCQTIYGVCCRFILMFNTVVSNTIINTTKYAYT